MRNFLLATAAGVLLAGVRTAGAGAGLPTSPYDFAIFALEGVELGQGAQVDEGDVGVNSPTGRFILRAQARVAGHAAANSIEPGRNARILGNMFCNTGPVGTPSCQAVTLPLVDTALLPIVTVSAGSQDVKLGPRLSSTIQPGKFGKVKVGTKSRLRLEGGTYSFRSLRIGKGASLLCDGSCTIGVDDAVQIDQSATLSTMGQADARKIRLNIEFGAPSRAALKASAKSTVDATVYAPAGIIRLGTNGRYTGAFVAKSVQVLQRARVVSAPQP